MKGKCLCGSIEVEVADQTDISICHCTMCRRWIGGPMFAVNCGTNVSFTGSKPARYKSSEWAERGFCSNCGTNLFYYLLSTGEYSLPAGLFQDQKFSISNQIFIDEKPDYYDFSNQTGKLTGQQAFEKYTPKK